MDKKELAVQIASVLAPQPEGEPSLPLVPYKDVRVDISSPSFAEAMRRQAVRHYEEHSYVGRILGKVEYGEAVLTEIFLADQVICDPDPSKSPAEDIFLKIVENLMFSDRNFERELHARAWARDGENAGLKFPDDCEQAKAAGAERLWIPVSHWMQMLGSHSFVDRMLPLTDRAEILKGRLGTYNGHCEILTDSFEYVQHKVLRGDTSWVFSSPEKMGQFSCDLTKLSLERNANSRAITIHMWVSLHMSIKEDAWFDKVQWTYK